LVAGGGPVLIDYDCMVVPALAGRAALEEGHPAYRHPRRKGEPVSLEDDRFPAWLLWLGLRAVAADPALYRRQPSAGPNPGLLFAERDLARPAGSAVWNDLVVSPDPEVRRSADRLRGVLDKPSDQVPPFAPDAAAAKGG